MRVMIPLQTVTSGNQGIMSPALAHRETGYKSFIIMIL
jgi:hypothetical protein